MNTTEISLESIVSQGVKLTPMMKQYYDIKKNYPDSFLMFRMGDFYELFFEDAKKAAKILNISLTHRGKLQDYPIPMAGIPYHAAQNYIDKITQVGLKVAICEQIEDPKEAKGIVKRDVTQVVSPSMPFDLSKDDQSEHKYMASAYRDDGAFFLVLVDYTTGKFFGLRAEDEKELVEQLQMYAPKEFICYLGQWDQATLIQHYLREKEVLITHLSEDYFNQKHTALYLEKFIPTFEKDETLKMDESILKAIGALSYYVLSTQGAESVNHLSSFRMINSQKDLKVTYPTLVGLEILPAYKEQYKKSLLGFMDKTKSSMGTRKLKTLFQAPSRDLQLIESRQAIIKKLVSKQELMKFIREELNEVRDIERILAKMTNGKVNGGDLLNLARAFECYLAITDKTKELFTKVSKDSVAQIESFAALVVKLINDEIGANLEKGNIIREGAHEERDKLAKLSRDVSGQLLEFELRYRETTSIPNLKVKHNNVAGYFIEVSKAHSSKVPKEFVRRQTLVNSERYICEELSIFEKEITTAKDRLYKLEKEIFDGIVFKLSNSATAFIELAESLAMIDVYQSLAWVAFCEDFTAPQVATKRSMKIQGAWHPLIKAELQDLFVPHDIELTNDEYFGLVTGPNMAGKTTVMREVAIVQFLTQIGSFVPARQCTVGLCDYLFSRLGASDDITKGQSTFMVEMSETSEIIRHATKDSLVILDEIGRGTSTYDGLSIAWALVEFFIQKTKSFTLFSTHYHELIDLVSGLDGGKNFTVKTKSENGDVKFLYKLIEEGATQSFGIHVAKLAGIPKQILARSEAILAELESTQSDNATPAGNMQLNLFAGSSQDSELRELIEQIDLNNTTPLQALNYLQKLKALN